jgi:predicted GH43/DUF377 family glycosyl hydrolase
MTEIRRSKENPVLISLSENTWEADGAFNGCPVRDGGKIHFVYRAISPPQKIAGHELPLSTVGYALSDDGMVNSMSSIRRWQLSHSAPSVLESA